MNISQAHRSDWFHRPAVCRGQWLCTWMGQDSTGVSAVRGGMFRSVAVGLSFIVSVAGMSGCRMEWPFDRSAALLDSGQFMETWKTYLHCRSSADPKAIFIDVLRLNHVAQLVSVRTRDSADAIPSAVRARIAIPPTRLSVDPHAMAAACALHGGSVAQAAGRPGLSVILFTAVVVGQRNSSNPYYAGEALQRLTEMEGERRSVGPQVAGLVGEMIPR